MLEIVCSYFFLISGSEYLYLNLITYDHGGRVYYYLCKCQIVNNIVYIFTSYIMFISIVQYEKGFKNLRLSFKFQGERCIY